MASLSILILAAGKGTRMKSTLPKVLHPVGGLPMIDRVLSTCEELTPSHIGIVVGHQAESVRMVIKKKYRSSQFFTQKQLNGSGGAVRQALSWLKKQKGMVIVTCGDTPLLTSTTLKRLVSAHAKQRNAATVLTTLMINPSGYGRIVRDYDDSVEKIVEELDATSDEKKIQEINTGSYCFEAEALARALPRLTNNNAKKEFYLTDVLGILKHDKRRVGAFVCADANESMGINRRRDLALAESILNRRTLDKLMDKGITIVDPVTTYIGDQVKIGADTVIWPQTFILGTTTIGSGCDIGPWSHVVNATIGNNVVVKASFVESSILKKGAKVGPFSRVRPKSVLGENSHLGNFSEVKNAQLGRGAKANHLSYLGDAKIGKNVNIGAGTITCNYDGIVKSPTFIEDHAFIGSNVNLIAPVRIGAHAVVGAGSSINQDVPAWSLAVERAARVIKKNWAKQKFKKGT
jgi:bifunctional UDP-N-acetylglucosamine pyrophosphorylase / glucosamine-1-phosphate N-acetyltransferase